MLKREKEQRSGDIPNLINFINTKTGKRVGVTPTIREEVSRSWPDLEGKFEVVVPPSPPDIGRVRSLYESVASDPEGREKLRRAGEIEGSLPPGENVGERTLLPGEADMRILAEAAALRGTYEEVWLLARDRHFIDFDEAIERELGIKVCPPSRFEELKEEIRRRLGEKP